ncbi:ATP-dependent metallopeptidase Hfl [Delitschia confertaspora ATCC 74209]|uniref:ATP-dependent metallopeptidase Hfl n=1 Tax=Delitschia confertaspora ATCC 74209 TaxID=1513339 RepID=A0A9P4JLK2_9PLEO|nr:ATP-dependent metallopeptidase Hfl [Delitschia confertaspora ATCC 74209]
MAFQAPVNLQSIASFTTELWPSMSVVLQSPWRGLSRQSPSRSSAPQAERPARSVSAETISTKATQGSSSLRLPESLSPVPMFALHHVPLAEVMSTVPSVSGTLASVPRSALHHCNPLARHVPFKSLIARQYSTASRISPFQNLRASPRLGQVGLALVQQRSLFNGSSSVSRSLLARLESTANDNPRSATAQKLFYSALLRAGMPEIIVERYQTGQFGTNSECEALYVRALERLGQTEKAAQLQSAKEAHGGNALTPEQLQAIGQAVGAHAGGGQVGKARSGTGNRSDPLYVVVEESMWSTIFKWARWLLTFGLTAYVALILITLFVETTGALKKVGGAGGTGEVKPEHQTTRFSDVHGCDEAKEELQDIVDFLKNPERYNKLGGRLPKGVLLTGPPGTGKTLLARAVAGEAGVPFFYMSGSEFDEVYVGVGAKRVRELFATARAKAPAIVFIDELDAVGGKRNGRQANYHRQTLNQLLNDLDGFDQSTGVIFIAATNHPQILDKALTRPGRFDRHVAVDLPDVRGRIEILKHHLQKIRIAPDVDISDVARGTPGFSGAELENLANTAAIHASKQKQKFVNINDLEWAKDKIMMGAEKRSRVVQLKDKLHTAYHEGGHALVGLYTKGFSDMHKATILPRGGANGITFFLPKDTTHKSRSEYFTDIQVAMGGKMAEEIVYGGDNVGSGASSDIQSATNSAYAMVTMFGFSERLGNIDFHSNYDRLSEDSKKHIDNEVRRLVDEARERAKKTLMEHRKELDLLAEALVKYETLDREEVLKVIKGEPLPGRMAATNSPIKLPDLPTPPTFVPPVPTPPTPSPPSPPGPSDPSGGVTVEKSS